MFTFALQRIGVAVSFVVATFAVFKLLQLISRLAENPGWSQPAWRIDYVILPAISGLFTLIAIKSSSQLGIISRLIATVSAAALWIVFLCFIYLTVVGKIYVE